MIVQKNFLKIIICVFGIYFIISCLRPNVLSQIGKSKIYGAVDVPEIETDPRPWEWMGGLETMSALWLDYKEEYLREDVQKYQEYAIYEVIVKTWTKAHRESYWLERWKLKRCKVVDNTFQFEEFEGEEKADLGEYETWK